MSIDKALYPGGRPTDLPTSRESEDPDREGPEKKKKEERQRESNPEKSSRGANEPKQETVAKHDHLDEGESAPVFRDKAYDIK